MRVLCCMQVYIGAGTSGRLGVLDASECPPTYNAAPGQIVGLIAGGEYALTNAVEGAEDDVEQGVQDVKDIGLSNKVRYSPMYNHEMGESNLRHCFNPYQYPTVININ